jgi:membrane-bound acyltransferase YfiQ involved in biofilm formation
MNPIISTNSTKIRGSEVVNERSFQLDNVRFLSMISIVFVHSALEFSHANSFVFDLVMQVFKFGSIGFYIAAGYLVGLVKTNDLNFIYLKKRLNNTAFPWLIWSGIYFAGFYIFSHSSTSSIDRLIRSLNFTLFFSNYWFVANFMIVLFITIMLRKQVRNPFFLLITILLSAFYGVNVYQKWIPTQHTTAILGFVTYMWLGVIFAENRLVLTAFVNRYKVALLVLTIISFIFANIEIYLLKSINPIDAYNTLRISNQIYSIGIFLLVYSLNFETYPQMFHPKNYTFGIYLVHSLILMVISKGIRAYGLERYTLTNNTTISMSLAVLLFLIVYTASIAVVNLTTKYLPTVIGARKNTKSTQAAISLVETPNPTQFQS